MNRLASGAIAAGLCIRFPGGASVRSGGNRHQRIRLLICVRRSVRPMHKKNKPAKVLVETIKKARNGRVNCRKAGYRWLASQTPAPPAAKPAAPPPRPPWRVALCLSATGKLFGLSSVLVMLALFFLCQYFHAGVVTMRLTC